MYFYSIDSFVIFYNTYKNSNKNLPYIIDNYFNVGLSRALKICSFFGYSLDTKGSMLTEAD
jgi:hypothetical protein